VFWRKNLIDSPIFREWMKRRSAPAKRMSGLRSSPESSFAAAQW
jgi:hypothetical protein